ncbi:MAG: hypothetical protein HND55_00820 [Pseudomonadota bacterium]|nr:MAG: hypothetical protein HND55_00820 [Pseudomonadota bacterium]
MKKPEISHTKSDPALAGTSGDSSWVDGRNCVYSDSAIANYRVSIRTPNGWKSFGHFNDLETASYVANIAILVEQCEDRYELNTGLGEKDKQALARWRNQGNNRELEKQAAERYKRVKSELEAYKNQVLEEERQKQRKEAEWQQAHEEKMSMLRGMTKEELVEFINSASGSDPYYVIAKGELRNRQN